jgi:ABC-type antimicrobial peptide transport system permease subunit
LGLKNTLAEYEVLLPIDLFNKIYNVELNETTYTQQSTIIEALGVSANIKMGSVKGKYNTYSVAGVTLGDSVVFADNKMSGTKGCFGEFIQVNKYPVTKIATLCQEEKTLANTIENLDAIGLQYLGKYSQSITEVSDSMQTIKIVMIVATVFIAIFAMYFMFTFFATVIVNNKKTIGVYRSLGVNTFSLISMLIISCGLLMLISIAIAMCLGTITATVLNSAFTSIFTIPISIININPFIYLYLLLIGIGMVSIGTIVPTIIYCNKTPIEVLKR